MSAFFGLFWCKMVSYYIQGFLFSKWLNCVSEGSGDKNGDIGVNDPFYKSQQVGHRY
jgi:hypothetical protein